MRDISKDELKEILRKHTLWVECKEGGERADLGGVDLGGADLRRADLRRADLWGADLRRADLGGVDLGGADLRRADLGGADLWGADLRRANLEGANLWGADLRRADLRRADLWGADLRRADLRGTNLDYSCWPLWCGSLDVKVDIRIAAQLAYHFCRLVCDDPAYIQARNALVPLANTFHRADECGRLEILEAGK